MSARSRDRQEPERRTIRKERPQPPAKPPARPPVPTGIRTPGADAGGSGMRCPGTRT